METSDAEQLMMPFFPNDPYLAVQSLSKALFDSDGLVIPEWIWEAVVQQYFMYLMTQRLMTKQEQLREQLFNEDPFKMMTVPYSLMDRPYMN